MMRSCIMTAKALTRLFIIMLITILTKLQTMRKEAGFEVTDRILVTVKTADEKLAAIVEANVDAIKNGVLALEVSMGDALEGAYVKAWSINGVDAELSVKKA